MPLELRPTWCLTDPVVDTAMTFGPWKTADGRPVSTQDGDSWSPGTGLLLRREIELDGDPLGVRQHLGVGAGGTVGVAARWTCRATFMAGVQTAGPLPVPLTSSTVLELDIPADIAESLEIETCLIVNWGGERPAGASPDGALIWSDGWSSGRDERTVLLEGSEARIPVSTVSFAERFGRPSRAMWAIDLDPSVGLEDLLSNVATVLLNKDVLAREFRGDHDEPDPTLLPPFALAGMSVDLVRGLTIALHEELTDTEGWQEHRDGSVGAMLVLRLTDAFGSVPDALVTLERDEPSFTRELWHRFAPDSWKARS